MMDKNKIIVFDTTLRDGEQSPGCSMNTEEKIKVALQLEKLGVDVIEAEFPALSPNPLIVTSICLAPFNTAAKVFAVAKPKSL